MTIDLLIVAMIALLPRQLAVETLYRDTDIAARTEFADVAQTRQGAVPETESRRFPPRDESANDPAFAEFRRGLLNAASRGDIGGILAATSVSVHVIGGSLPAEEFLKQQGVRQGQPWKALREALELGAVYASDRTIVAPYLAAAHDLDSAEYVAMGRNVRLRDSASISGRIVSNLDYGPVTVLIDHRTDFDAHSPDDSAAWAHVRTDSGKTGFVFVRLLRSASGPRYYFEKVDGLWKLVSYSFDD